MIKKFFRDNSMHKGIVKYFDFIFLFNLPYFFILFMLFTWGMSASYYSNNLEEGYYFLLYFNISDVLFFISLFLFLSIINIKLQLDDLLILDWNNKDGKYKTNLNHLYVSPNFISIKKVEFLFSGTGRSLIFITLIPIAFISSYLWPILILYYILIIYFNKKLLETKNYSIFILRCLLKLVCFYLIFLSGWTYLSSFDIISILEYIPFFCLAVIPIILINEIIVVDKFSNIEKENRQIINNHKKKIAFLSLFMMIILFFISFNANDPILTHFSIIVIPFLFYSFFRLKNKDFIRSYSYPIMIMNILISWTLYPILLIIQLFIYYFSKYYYWHRFNIHFPKFVIEENE